jgi:hypothetical protein
VADRLPVPRLNDPGGFALGERVLSALTTVGVRQTAWRWRYNTQVPRPTGSFEPHRELAGSHLQELPSEEGYWPGDHHGCLCEAVPVLRGPDGRFLRAG